MGIASFVLSIVMGVVLFLLVVVLGILEMSTPGGIDEESATSIILSLLVIASLFAELVALGLGVAGILQRRRKRIFAILGTIFSGSMFFVVIALAVVGLLLG